MDRASHRLRGNALRGVLAAASLKAIMTPTARIGQKICSNWLVDRIIGQLMRAGLRGMQRRSSRIALRSFYQVSQVVAGWRPQAGLVPAVQINAQGLLSKRRLIDWSFIQSKGYSLVIRSEIEKQQQSAGGSVMKYNVFFATALMFFLSAPAQSQELTSAACHNQATGWAECDAVCPAGQLVLHCSYTLGNYGADDNCDAIVRMHVGATAANGQPYEQPHDRCNVGVQCSNGSQSISVQGFATCYQP